MYGDFFGFSALPFQLTPDPRFFFHGPTHRRAVAHLLFGLEQREGFVVVTGEAGCGKTAMLGHLLDTIADGAFAAGTVLSSRLDGDDMLRAAASAFDLPFEGADKVALLRRLRDFLAGCHDGGIAALLLVDEAHNLSPAALDELRMLSNLSVGSEVPLQTVLLGLPRLGRLIIEQEPLRQRVVATCHLGPMGPSETHDYVLHRLNVAGWADDPEFGEDCFAPIHAATGGVPRRVNQLCAHLLLACRLDESHRVDGAAVIAAADELPLEAD